MVLTGHGFPEPDRQGLGHADRGARQPRPASRRGQVRARGEGLSPRLRGGRRRDGDRPAGAHSPAGRARPGRRRVDGPYPPAFVARRGSPGYPRRARSAGDPPLATSAGAPLAEVSPAEVSPPLSAVSPPPLPRPR